MRIVQQTKIIENYTRSFPKDVQSILRKMREAIQKAMPEAVEVISYGIPAFKYKGRILIYFAAWKKHVSVYPFTSAIEKSLKKETVKYEKTGKGTIQFQFDEAIPYGLIKKITRFRAKEISENLKGN